MSIDKVADRNSITDASPPVAAKTGGMDSHAVAGLQTGAGNTRPLADVTNAGTAIDFGKLPAVGQQNLFGDADHNEHSGIFQTGHTGHESIHAADSGDGGIFQVKGGVSHCSGDANAELQDLRDLLSDANQQDGSTGLADLQQLFKDVGSGASLRAADMPGSASSGSSGNGATELGDLSRIDGDAHCGNVGQAVADLQQLFKDVQGGGSSGSPGDAGKGTGSPGDTGKGGGTTGSGGCGADGKGSNNPIAQALAQVETEIGNAMSEIASEEQQALASGNTSLATLLAQAEQALASAATQIAKAEQQALGGTSPAGAGGDSGGSTGGGCGAGGDVPSGGDTGGGCGTVGGGSHGSGCGAGCGTVGGGSHGSGCGAGCGTVGGGSHGSGCGAGCGTVGGGGNSGKGTDMSSIFVAGDSGVTKAQMQHAIAIADALPEDMKQALLANHVQMTLNSGFSGGPEGQNDGTQGQFYTDSGMADQAEVHELYEMYGQITNNGPGSWSDPKAVALADKGMQAKDSSGEGDLNDTVGAVHGDGDHMSNAFTADFFATHPDLYQDTFGKYVLTTTAADDPNLEKYIAQAQDLKTA